MAYVGTANWSARTGGSLRPVDRAELIRLAAVTGFRDLPNYVRYRAHGTQRLPDPVGFHTLDPPRTDTAETAERALSALAPRYVYHHSLRTYWFSRLIGICSGIEFDNEILYLASLAHDIGMFDVQPRSDARCFSIRGARWAGDIAQRGGWDSARITRLTEAITLNLNGRVSPKRGPEAHLMMRGVLVDVTGLHAWRINPSDVDDVFAKIHRLEQDARLPPLFAAEAHRFPDCRGHFADRWLGFGLLMRHAPWHGLP